MRIYLSRGLQIFTQSKKINFFELTVAKYSIFFLLFMASKRGSILKYVCQSTNTRMYHQCCTYLYAHKSSQYGGIKWRLAFETLHLIFVLAKTNNVQGVEKRSVLTVRKKQEQKGVLQTGIYFIRLENTCLLTTNKRTGEKKE